MKTDSLVELRSAFTEWRRSKKHATEPIPEKLLDQARRTAKEHGVNAVIAVTRIQRARLLPSTLTRTMAPVATGTESKDILVPTFSRLELAAPAAPNPRTHPIAEVKMGTGVTIRVFEPTPEMMGLLSAVCGLGGVR